MEIFEFCTVFEFSEIYEGTGGFPRGLGIFWILKILGYFLEILWGQGFLGILGFVFCGLSHSQHLFCCLVKCLVHFEDKEFSGQAQAQALARFAALLQINPLEFS